MSGATAPADPELRALLGEARTIAVVGASSNQARDSNRVARYLQEKGYRVIPVNPKETEVLGERAYATLSEIPERVDVVDVFRRAERTPEVAREAARIGAKVLWLQEGIVSAETARIAREAGMELIMGVCIRRARERLTGEEEEG